MIDSIDRRVRVASHRAHRHNPFQDPDGPYLDVHELLPMRDEVAAVAVIRGGQELARWRLDEQAPDLHLEEVRRRDRDGGSDFARLEWTVAQGQEAETPAALVRYSVDGGAAGRRSPQTFAPAAAWSTWTCCPVARTAASKWWSPPAWLRRQR